MYLCYICWRSSKSLDPRYRFHSPNDSHWHVTMVEGAFIHRTLCGIDPRDGHRFDMTVAVCMTPRGGFDPVPTEPPLARPVCLACMRSSGGKLGRLMVRGLAEVNQVDAVRSLGDGQAAV